MLEAQLVKYRLPLIFFLLGLLILGVGVFFLKTDNWLVADSKIEVLSSHTVSDVVVDVVGAVRSPGIYKLKSGSRVNDAIDLAGGVTSEADDDWITNNLNRASLLTDGQKINILKQSEVSTASKSVGDHTISPTLSSRGSGRVNINSALPKELDLLPGIGPTYGQYIIEQRPYSSVDELLTKGVLKKAVFENIKDLVSVN